MEVRLSARRRKLGEHEEDLDLEEYSGILDAAERQVHEFEQTYRLMSRHRWLIDDSTEFEERFRIVIVAPVVVERGPIDVRFESHSNQTPIDVRFESHSNQTPIDVRFEWDCDGRAISQLPSVVEPPIDLTADGRWVRIVTDVELTTELLKERVDHWHQMYLDERDRHEQLKRRLRERDHSPCSIQ